MKNIATQLVSPVAPMSLNKSSSLESYPGLESLRTLLVALVFITSFISRFQPAPCDIIFVLAVMCSLSGGLRFNLVLIPLFFLLLLYNLSGLMSYMLIPVSPPEDGKQYLFGLAYTSFSGLFFAAYIAQDPVKRFEQIMKAYIIGATIGALIGLLSTFKVEPIATWLPDFGGRTVGFYKDPNVYSTWLVLPALYMLHGFLLGKLRLHFFNLASFVLIFAALFLSFSRGAWINMIMATALSVFFSFALSPSPTLRVRIILAFVFGTLIMGVILALLLSIPATQELFLDRFTLVKSYDAGETGRFGNQLNSLPLLIERPLGLGPYQFAAIFGLAPHNTFINSFASAGWLGGISFIVFVLSTFIVGFKLVFTRTPFQTYAFVAFSGYVAVTLQGVQIDTEHWRHLYWMVGMVWGFFAASIPYVTHPPSTAEIYKAWNLKLPQRRQAA
jgi:hypothetical protein